MTLKLTKNLFYLGVFLMLEACGTSHEVSSDNNTQDTNIFHEASSVGEVTQADLSNEDEEEQRLRALLGLPNHFSLPAIPDYNPLTEEKIELGRFLFYDTRLSGNETMSCASCHLQEKAFSDGVAKPVGATGHIIPRNSQGLANVAYHSTLTWANSGFLEFEDQLSVPIRADDPVELGVTPNLQDEVLKRFDDDADYVEMFQKAFPESDSGATIQKIIFALSSFCRTLISGSSPYDRYIQGDTSALSEQAIRGLNAFNSEKFECFHCHNGINLSTSYRDSRITAETIRFPFFNNGLYNVDGNGSYPEGNQGLFEVTQNPQDRGMFRPPSLRNVEVTGPYMHDGSIETLREVILHYAAGGRNLEDGPHAGDGRVSPLKSGLIQGFRPTEQEIEDLLAFLNSLTDTNFLNNPKFQSPF